MVIAGSVLSSAFAAGLTTILGVELGDVGFGIYAFAIATAGLLGTLSRVGLDPIVVRDIARSVEDGKSRLGSRRPIVTALAITGLVALVLVLLTISPPGAALLESAGDLDFAMVGGLALLFSSQALYTINTQALRGLHYLGHASFLGLPIQRLVSFLLVAWVVWIAADDLTVSTAIWLTAAAAAVAVAASGYVLWSRTRGVPGGAAKPAAAVRMAKDGAPVLLTDVLGVAGSRLPIWVLAIVGTLGDAGVFALATSFVALIRIAHKAAVDTLAPFVATAYHEGSREGLQNRVRVVAAGAALLAILASIGLVVVGSFAVPRLFGDGFEDAVPVATILLLGIVAIAMVGPTALLLNVTGNERWTARSSLISTGLAAALIIPATLAGGAIGAAAVMAASRAIGTSLQLRYVRRETGVDSLADFPALWRSLRRGRRQG